MIYPLLWDGQNDMQPVTEVRLDTLQTSSSLGSLTLGHRMLTCIRLYSNVQKFEGDPPFDLHF